MEYKENLVISKTSILIEKIHHDIFDETYLFAIDLVKHTIQFSLAISLLWFMIKLTELIFPNIPFAVEILVYISEIIIIVHFVKKNIYFKSREGEYNIDGI